jgi:inorganic pyrophosphatase
MSYSAVHQGQPETLEYRIYLEKDGKRISPWNDIPLVADPEKKLYSFVAEIPKNSHAKIETSLEDTDNPLKQDIKNGKLRYIADVNGQTGYPWNYGCFPQTWEDPKVTHPATGFPGDDDPLDGCEIGSKIAKMGDILQVKVLGTIALIDEGETDWKIICIDVNDPEAEKFNDVEDVEKHRPGYLAMVRDWFRDYKIPDGKPPNKFAFNGEAKNKSFVLELMEEYHSLWKAHHDKTNS